MVPIATPTPMPSTQPQESRSDALKSVERGSEAMLAGAVDLADEHFTHAINLAPSFSTPLLARAELRLEQGRIDEAAVDLRIAAADSRGPHHSVKRAKVLLRMIRHGAKS